MLFVIGTSACNAHITVVGSLVTLVNCGETAKWIEMPVGIGPVMAEVTLRKVN